MPIELTACDGHKLSADQVPPSRRTLRGTS